MTSSCCSKRRSGGQIPIVRQEFFLFDEVSVPHRPPGRTMLSRLVKANSDWMIPSIPGFVRSFVFFAISVSIVFSDRNFTHRDRKVRKGQFGWMTPSIPGSSVPLGSLRSLCGLSFLIGILHTEIAKITKTDSDWITLFDSLTLFSLRSLRSLCGLSFRIGILHAKITKTDSGWITFSIP